MSFAHLSPYEACIRDKLAALGNPTPEPFEAYQQLLARLEAECQQEGPGELLP